MDRHVEKRVRKCFIISKGNSRKFPVVCSGGGDHPHSPAVCGAVQLAGGGPQTVFPEFQDRRGFCRDRIVAVCVDGFPDPVRVHPEDVAVVYEGGMFCAYRIERLRNAEPRWTFSRRLRYRP